MKAELPNHEPSLMLMNCGDSILSRPSVGSWVTYGLGSDNKNTILCFDESGGYPIKGRKIGSQDFYLVYIKQHSLIVIIHRLIN